MLQLRLAELASLTISNLAFTILIMTHFKVNPFKTPSIEENAMRTVTFFLFITADSTDDVSVRDVAPHEESDVSVRDVAPQEENDESEMTNNVEDEIDETEDEFVEDEIEEEE